MDAALERTATRDRGAGPSGRTVLLWIVGLVLAVRVVLEFVGLLSLASVYHGEPFEHPLSLWLQWDAPHYLRLAKVGYHTHGTGDDALFIVFFPLFPLAVRIVSIAVGNLVVSGLFVSFVASIGAAWLLYKLVRLDADHDEAWRAVVLLFCFPTGYFLSAPYSEALFLCMVLASIYAARTRRWVGAGVSGAIATGTRLGGIALLPALALEALSGPVTQRVRARRLFWVAVAGGGLAFYLLINLVLHGDPVWFLRVQRTHWHQHVALPWETILIAGRELIFGHRGASYAFIYATRIAAAVFAVPMLVVASRRLRTADALYGWIGLVIVLTSSWLISLPRYLLPLYPIFMVEAKLTENRRWFTFVVTVGVVLQGFFFWRYVRAEWAF